jgi:hypothetical protein
VIQVIADARYFVMEEAMLHFSRSDSIISAPLAIAAVLVFVTPAGAKLAANRLAANGIAQTGVAARAHISSGSALADFNGVAVEAVIIPDAALR